MFPFQRLQSWKLPSPGVQEPVQPGPRESDRSPTPSTMDYPHGGPGDPPADPMAGLPTPSTLTHPHGGQRYTFSSGVNSHLVRPSTSSPSLIPADPRHDKGFLERCRDHFTALCERLKTDEESHKN